MYQQWCKGGEDNPNIDEQSLLNVMLKRKDLAKFGVKFRYLDTDQFSGFCQIQFCLISCLLNCILLELVSELGIWFGAKSTFVDSKPFYLFHKGNPHDDAI